MIKERILFELHEDTESILVLESGRPDHYMLLTETVNEAGYAVHNEYITQKQFDDLQARHPEVKVYPRG